MKIFCKVVLNNVYIYMQKSKSYAVFLHHNFAKQNDGMEPFLGS